VTASPGASADLARAADAIARRGGALGHPLHLLDETTSTNDEAKSAARTGAPHGATWIAETQTAGRGRQGRAWISLRGENLLFSVLLRVASVPSRLPQLALVAGLAVRDAVALAAPHASVRIKWPNDVVVGAERRKVAGVLVETTMVAGQVAAIVVGIGINVHTRAFPSELENHATSVALLGTASSAPPERAEILADVLAILDRDVALVAARGLGLVHARLTAADALRGEVVANDDGAEGCAEGIDLEGRLMVRRADGALVRWQAGEVHLVPRADSTARSTTP
jgi:BirA family biotin operon repressor/biotin-[acetyl-CoA-carboxylase] ligase